MGQTMPDPVSASELISKLSIKGKVVRAHKPLTKSVFVRFEKGAWFGVSEVHEIHKMGWTVVGYDERTREAQLVPGLY